MEWGLKDSITDKHMSAVMKKIVQMDKESTIGRMETITKGSFRTVWDMVRAISGKERGEFNIEDNTKTTRSAATGRLTMKMG